MKIGVDIDGTLCEREVTCTPEECIRAERSNIPVPSDSHEIYVVSSRTRNMEEETRGWLAEYGIEYKRLILHDMESFEGLSEEEIDRKQVSFKAGAIKEFDLDVYVEDRPNVRK